MERSNKYMVLIEHEENPPKLSIDKQDMYYLYEYDECAPTAGYLKWQAQFNERKDACLQEWREQGKERLF